MSKGDGKFGRGGPRSRRYPTQTANLCRSPSGDMKVDPAEGPVLRRRVLLHFWDDS